MHRFVPTDRAAERIARCVLGLALFGVGIALIIRAELARPRATSSTPASAS